MPLLDPFIQILPDIGMLAVLRGIRFDSIPLYTGESHPTDADDLCWLLQAFVQAHHTCTFPRPFLDRITTGGKTAGLARRTRDHRCLKRLKIQEVSIDDTGVLGDVILFNKNKEFVAILVYSGDRWLMYWPTRPVEHMY